MSSTLAPSYQHPLPDGSFLPMRLVRSGYFIMGSEAEDAYDDEKPELPVFMPHDYYMGCYPVTQTVWQAVMGDLPEQDFVDAERPVTSISWTDIVTGNQDNNQTPSFLSQLNAIPKSEASAESLANFSFRLPTEAEWEYAAKGGHLYSRKDIFKSKAADWYPPFSGSSKIKEVAWYDKNSQSMTHAVGQKRPNALGLYDLSGNVWEWCYDWFDSDFYQKQKNQLAEQKDPFIEHPYNLKKAVNRVLRGGAYFFSPRNCRVSCRHGFHPSYRDHHYGFRVVLSSLSLR